MEKQDHPWSWPSVRYFYYKAVTSLLELELKEKKASPKAKTKINVYNNTKMAGGIFRFFYLLYYFKSVLQKQITIYYKSKVKQHYCIDDQRLNVRSDQRSLGFRVFLQQIGVVTFK